IKRFVIIGFDGMDPNLVESMITEGKLPNIARLKEQGCMKSLATTTPPISPVAWSSFQTGSNPGKHNIFDFLTRDKHTYLPVLSSTRIVESKRSLRLGKYKFPLGRNKVQLLRKGKAFWQVLGEHGFTSNILRVPISFPPEKIQGLQLSAMCVPDLLGTQGTYSYYCSGEVDNEAHPNGIAIRVNVEAGKISTYLQGPSNSFVRDNAPVTVPFVIKLKGESKAQLKIDGHNIILRKNQYSEWVNVRFKLAPGVKIHGICRFLLLSAEHEFRLYVTPVNLDPLKPAMPISHPAVYATYLAKRQGPFATLGLAEDTGALNEHVINDDQFLQQCALIEQERIRMFRDALVNLESGLCVCVFDGTDRIQHMFWRQIDKDHPANNNVPVKLKGDREAIQDVYGRMDEVVGEAMKRCDDDRTVLMVMSDHGFAPFRYGIDLNRWLADNGYLAFKKKTTDSKYLRDVDWSRTRAYALGLAGIFVNLLGREKLGIVCQGSEADELRREIAEKLCELKHSGHQEQPIVAVHDSHKIYSGPYYKDNAPDLIVGYNRGYRVSWDAAIGRITNHVFSDNTKAWSGDHCIEPSLVPGVMICNRAIDTDKPSLQDIGPTVLDMFGVAVPKFMDGAPMLMHNADGKLPYTTAEN
ncbi:MAG: alkaline phosphatase family protein, partial [Lentisphaerae bacterium]|nr:alkaline phosphatase family protein [Lentisphaerota bacterium]